MITPGNRPPMTSTLNESPSEKEGKSKTWKPRNLWPTWPSMKVPPKRKGNHPLHPVIARRLSPSMKVPPKRKGNILPLEVAQRAKRALNESPSEKEGKCDLMTQGKIHPKPSMKVPPKRKGNVAS